ncbi:MAG: hypothetical protein PHX30_04885 [Candidatus Pacebacteria bacterium]|jgi:hypothetical protein|nr:hypothetical protein [Candidatus Paceibacterota bacterium]
MVEVTQEDVVRIKDAFAENNLNDKAIFLQTVGQIQFLSVCKLMSSKEKRLAEGIVRNVVFGI